MSDTQVKQLISGLLNPQRVTEPSPLLISQPGQSTSTVPFNEKFLSRQESKSTPAEQSHSSASRDDSHPSEFTRDVNRRQPEPTEQPRREPDASRSDSLEQKPQNRVNSQEQTTESAKPVSEGPSTPTPKNTNDSESGTIKKPVANIEVSEDALDTTPTVDEVIPVLPIDTTQQSDTQATPVGLSEFLSIPVTGDQSSVEDNTELNHQTGQQRLPQNSDSEVPAGLVSFLSNNTAEPNTDQAFSALEEETSKFISAIEKINGPASSTTQSEAVQQQPVPVVVNQQPPASNTESEQPQEQQPISPETNTEQPVAKNLFSSSVEFVQSSNQILTGSVSEIALEKLINLPGSDISQSNAPSLSTTATTAISNASSPSTLSTTGSAANTNQMISIDDPEFPARLGHLLQQAELSGKSLKIRLNPPELGTLQIEVTRQQGQVVARLETESVLTQGLLTEHLGALKETLESQGMRVEKFEVEVNENLREDQFADTERGEAHNESEDHSPSAGQDQTEEPEEQPNRQSANIVADENLDIIV